MMARIPALASLGLLLSACDQGSKQAEVPHAVHSATPPPQTAAGTAPDALEFEQAMAVGTIPALVDFWQQHPGTAQAAEAVTRIHNLQYEASRKHVPGDPWSLLLFEASPKEPGHPGYKEFGAESCVQSPGGHARLSIPNWKARLRMAARLANMPTASQENKDWADTLRKDTSEAYVAFWRKHPESRKLKAVRGSLRLWVDYQYRFGGYVPIGLTLDMPALSENLLPFSIGKALKYHLVEYTTEPQGLVRLRGSGTLREAVFLLDTMYLPYAKDLVAVVKVPTP